MTFRKGEPEERGQGLWQRPSVPLSSVPNPIALCFSLTRRDSRVLESLLNE